MIGLTFDRLKIIKQDNDNNKRWICLCSCGQIKSILSCHLRSGRIKSCGCLRQEKSKAQAKNLLNMVFGRLTVIKRIGDKKVGKDRTSPHWLCLCICGVKITTTSANLLSRCKIMWLFA